MVFLPSALLCPGTERQRGSPEHCCQAEGQGELLGLGGGSWGSMRGPHHCVLPELPPVPAQGSTQGSSLPRCSSRQSRGSSDCPIQVGM